MVRNLDLTALRSFAAVADAGGVTRAADLLHRVPSNVTTRIKQFEDRLGVALFRRQGRSLTLTEADYVFVLDPWWNPAVEAQAVDRAHRIGQTRPVMVYRLVATDTIEEKVMELKARKAALFQQVVDGDGALSGAVTADDVRALFGA